MKVILNGKKARRSMIYGMNRLHDAVCCTLGPAGRNVLIKGAFGEPRVTKDGVSVAKEVILDDPTEEAGAQLVRAAASKTCDDVGDSTTTVTVLTASLVNGAYKLMNTNPNIRPIDIKRGMDEACRMASAYIREHAIKCNEELALSVATIAANNDRNIGKLVYDAIRKAGKDGAVTIETSPTNYSYVETIMGMKFERGWESQYFTNDEFQRECAFEGCNILLFDGKIDNLNSFIKILEPSINIGRPLLIIADDYDMEVINALAINKVQNGFKICAIKAPAFKKQRKLIMEDLSILLGAKIVNSPRYRVTDQRPFNVDWLGSCDKVVITRHDTIIVGGDGDKKLIDKRCEELRVSYDTETDKDEKAAIKDRLAKLAGGVSIIYVGSDSETETGEIKDRVEDAVCSMRAAMAEGVVPGGGSMYIALFDELVRNEPMINERLINGYKTVEFALLAPITRMLVNSFYSTDEVTKIIQTIRAKIADDKKPMPRFGMNIETGLYANDMIEEGVVDSAKASRMALENAVSVAGMFITTECSIVDDTRPKE